LQDLTLLRGSGEGTDDEMWLAEDSIGVVTTPNVARLEFVEDKSATYDNIFRVEFKWLRLDTLRAEASSVDKSPIRRLYILDIYLCRRRGTRAKGSAENSLTRFWCWAHLSALFPNLCVLSRENLRVEVAVFLSGDSLSISLAAYFDADSAREEDVFWDK